MGSRYSTCPEGMGHPLPVLSLLAPLPSGGPSQDPHTALSWLPHCWAHPYPSAKACGHCNRATPAHPRCHPGLAQPGETLSSEGSQGR